MTTLIHVLMLSVMCADSSGTAQVEGNTTEATGDESLKQATSLENKVIASNLDDTAPIAQKMRPSDKNSSLHLLLAYYAISLNPITGGLIAPLVQALFTFYEAPKTSGKYYDHWPGALLAGYLTYAVGAVFYVMPATAYFVATTQSTLFNSEARVQAQNAVMPLLYIASAFSVAAYLVEPAIFWLFLGE